MAMTPKPSPRVVRVTSETMELAGISGRVLFPTMRQGPWLPIQRLAESSAQGPWVPDLHAHVSEEIVNYVLSGRILEIDAEDHRIESGEGTVIVHASGGEYRHDVGPVPGQRARWLSVIRSFPRPEKAAGSPSQVYHELPTAEISSGVVMRALVGGTASARSEWGTELSAIEFRRPGTATLPVGPARRAVVYVTDGQGTVAQGPAGPGDGVMTEDLASLEVEGPAGLRLVLVTAPTPVY